MSVRKKTFPFMWEWQMLLFAFPGIIVNPEAVEPKKERIGESRALISGEFTISHKWKAPQEVKYEPA
jgi:hypothetical protein